MALERVLIPLDGSPLADGILTHVRRLLTRADAQVDFLHIHDGRPAAASAGRQHLEALAGSLEAEGRRAAVHVLQGDPAEEIVRAAEALDVGMIAMATHGRSGVSRVLRGSVAEQVLRTSARPLFMANPLALAPEWGPRRFNRILVPLAGSAAAAEILPLVGLVARCLQSEVLLLRVEHALGLNRLETEPIAGGVTAFQPLSAVRASLVPLQRALQAQGLQVRILASYGSEADEILHAAELEDVDLVAMSTHGRSGVARWFRGSVTEEVLRRCSTPLLVRRPGVTSSPLGRPTPSVGAGVSCAKSDGSPALIGRPATSISRSGRAAGKE